MAIVFNDLFRKSTMKVFGVRFRDAEATIQNAEQRELISTGLGASDIRLYLKRREDARPPQHLLVLTERAPNGDDKVVDAIPIPSRWVAEDTTPLAALINVCNECGHEFGVGDRRGKFFLQERVEVDPQRMTDPIDRPPMVGKPWSVKYWLAPAGRGAVNVYLAYVLDPALVKRALLTRL